MVPGTTEEVRTRIGLTTTSRSKSTILKFFVHVCLSTMVRATFPCDRLFEHQDGGSECLRATTFGQKVVRPHVTTDSGRRVLTKIKFDVMSVRELLMSTSALKRQGVTISFSHDYDRIIFRIESLNSGARDSYSYLHVTLTNKTLPRNATVITDKMYGMG